MHGLGLEQYIIIAIFCLCADKPLNCISSYKFHNGYKSSEILMYESILLKF